KVPIHRRLRPYLFDALKHARGKPFVFCAPASPQYPNGDHPVDDRDLLVQTQALAKQLNIPVGRKNSGFVIHSLRHFASTYCKNHGVPERAVDAWLGHVGKRSSAASYYHLPDDESQEFMNKLRF